MKSMTFVIASFLVLPMSFAEEGGTDVGGGSVNAKDITNKMSICMEATNKLVGHGEFRKASAEARQKWEPLFRWILEQRDAGRPESEIQSDPKYAQLQQSVLVMEAYQSVENAQVTLLVNACMDDLNKIP